MGLFGFGKKNKEKEQEKMKTGLEKTRTGFWGNILNTLTGSVIDDDMYDDCLLYTSTSSRQLRAAGKMEDVIFGGTRRRGAMGFAQVRLTLDNADHTFDVDADEVTIGRKYYRSGDSEYTINGRCV